MVRFKQLCVALQQLIFHACMTSTMHPLILYIYPKEKTKQDIMEEQVEMVGRAFVEHYYHLFDTDRSSLASLYHQSSMLTFEGQKLQGVENICSKISQLPFDKCQHHISTIDTQPSSFAGGIAVFVSGSLQLAGEEHLLRFSQVFFSFFILGKVPFQCLTHLVISIPQ